MLKLLFLSHISFRVSVSSIIISFLVEAQLKLKKLKNTKKISNIAFNFNFMILIFLNKLLTL